METQQAIVAFDALAQETRLSAFRFLVEQGPAGVPAGILSENLKVPHNTLSFHLAQLSHAGLVLSRRKGRSIIYMANFEFFNSLIRFMVEDCCTDRFASIRNDRKRGLSVIELANCCSPKEK